MTVPECPWWTGHADVAWIPGPGRVALLHLDHLDRPPLILEGSSAVIWELVAGGIGEDVLIETIAQLYEVDRVQVAEQVSVFVRELGSLGLVLPGEHQ